MLTAYKGLAKLISNKVCHLLSDVRHDTQIGFAQDRGNAVGTSKSSEDGSSTSQL